MKEDVLSRLREFIENGLIELWRENEPKEGCYLQGPLQRGMQPLLLSLLQFGKLGPSKVPLGGYRLRWTLVDDVSVGWDHPLDL